MRLHEILLERDFIDIAKKKNRWIESLKKGDLQDIKDNLYVLIDNAYAPLGGHVRIKKPNDILDPKITYWEAVDSDKDPDADAVLFGSKRRGIKISGVGHDGTKEGKSALMKRKISVLKKPGYWVESSGRPAQIQLSAGVPFLDKQEDVEKIFGPVTWIGNPGWYVRDLGGGKMTDQEMVFGKPKI